MKLNKKESKIIGRFQRLSFKLYKKEYKKRMNSDNLCGMLYGSIALVEMLRAGELK